MDPCCSRVDGRGEHSPPLAKTASTSALLVTLPVVTESLSLANGEPSEKPAAVRGALSLEASRTRQLTSSPRSSACKTASLPVPPLAPKTAMLRVGARARGATAAGERAGERRRPDDSSVENNMSQARESVPMRVFRWSERNRVCASASAASLPSAAYNTVSPSMFLGQLF